MTSAYSHSWRRHKIAPGAGVVTEFSNRDQDPADESERILSTYHGSASVMANPSHR